MHNAAELKVRNMSFEKLTSENKHFVSDLRTTNISTKEAVHLMLYIKHK